jgi:release factor glutamine methyltransferase
MHRNVLENEPGLALFVPGSDPLLFYSAIARWSVRFLLPEGRGLTEINERLGGETEEVFRSSGFHHTLVRKDVFDRNRFVLYSKNTL